MALFSRFKLGGAFGDLRLFFASRQRHEIVFFVLALAVTGFIIYAVNKDSYFERAPDITYFENFPVNRSDAEIAKGNKQRSEERHAYQAERQRQFKVLADQLGIEVDNKQ